MARDRNEIGGSLGEQSAGQGERTRRAAAQGDRSERERAREGKLSATAPRTRNAAKAASADETPRRPKRSSSGAKAGLQRSGNRPAGGRYGGVKSASAKRRPG